MGNDRFARLKKATATHLAMEAREIIRQLEEFPEPPGAMAYFYELFQQLYSGEKPLAPDEILIGAMCVQVPEELIHAAGARPLRLCNGAYAYDQAGADFMPAKSCPLVKATAGLLHVNQELWGRALKTVVIPTTCDQKKKSVELLKSMDYRVYPLEMPPAKDSEAARFYWQESVKRFALDLQGITGVKITGKRLRQAISKSRRATELFREFYRLRNSSVPVILGSDALLVDNAYFFDDLDSWTTALSALLAELNERRAQGFRAANRKAPRLLLTGSPPIFPNLKVPLLCEQAGAVIVVDEACSSSRLLYDTVVYDEENLNDMVPAIADRYLKPCTCPCLADNQDRLRKLDEMANSFKVDGVIYQAFSGCVPYEMEERWVSKQMQKSKTPVLSLETDYSPEDLGQLSTRIEAFIESLKLKKRKRA